MTNANHEQTKTSKIDEIEGVPAERGVKPAPAQSPSPVPAPKTERVKKKIGEGEGNLKKRAQWFGSRTSEGGGSGKGGGDQM